MVAQQFSVRIHPHACGLRRPSPRSLVLAGLLAASAALAAAPAQAQHLTMDELPLQPADGLHVGGVRFGYSIDGQADWDASFASYGVGDLAYVQDPSLEGSTRGTLRVDFDVPVTQLAFGIALQSEDALDDAITVSLLDAAGVSVAQFALDTMPLLVFSEARFDWAGAPVSSFTLDFADHDSRFVFDNLAFTSAVPEPASALLLAAGLCLLGCTGRRR